MTIHPRVFVVNEPLKRDETGAWARTMDLSPAEEHGTLIFLLPAGNGPRDPEPTIETLLHKLRDFQPTDYLLPVGHPLYIAWAAAIAAQNADGQLQTLLWDGRTRTYRAVAAQLWTEWKDIEEPAVA